MESVPVEPAARRVLIADDERAIADTLGIILRKSGFQTSTVYDGKDAVESAQHWIPDIFLTDVVMPEMNGIEAAIRIRAAVPACKVLLLSGQAMTSDLLHEARLLGHSFEILTKPVHPAELLDRLKAL
jgi:CheY-like chemotaxis protein